tara:strand:- start:131 stop:508 length:378 start_codon:yes stop_codon:yes gene_type:complete
MRGTGSPFERADSIERDIDQLSRLVRNALSDMYSWLTLRALNWEDWREVPGWTKKAVRELDMAWALKGSRSDYLDERCYIVLRQRVFEVREWIRTAPEELEGLPDVEQLWSAVSSFGERFDREAV